MQACASVFVSRFVILVRAQQQSRRRFRINYSAAATGCRILGPIAQGIEYGGKRKLGGGHAVGGSFLFRSLSCSKLLQYDFQSEPHYEFM